MSSLSERQYSDRTIPLRDGVEGRFTHAGSAAVRTHVLFTDRYQETDVFGQAVGNTGPAAIGDTDAFEDVATDDLLEVKNRDGEWVTYYIISIGEDEDGLRTFKLSTKPLHG